MCMDRVIPTSGLWRGQQLSRMTFELSDEAAADLEELQRNTGLSKTDLVNRAVQLRSWTETHLDDPTHRLFLRESDGKAWLVVRDQAGELWLVESAEQPWKQVPAPPKGTLTTILVTLGVVALVIRRLIQRSRIAAN